MKKIAFLLASFWLIASCKEAPKEYVTFSGKILNKNSDSIVLSNRKLKFKKIIKIDENGVFKDTFNLKNNFLSLFDGKEYGVIFLRNGDEVKMTLDAKMFDETITFEGSGAEESNFLAKRALMEENFFKDDSIFYTSKEDFEKKYKLHNKSFLRELEETESTDSLFLTEQNKGLKNFKKYVNKTYENKNYILKNLKAGTVSPEFTKPYESFDGKKISLADLKGKYLYIDIWATWCGYCKQETPHLKKIAKKYEGKNITFVGISVDRDKKYNVWKKVVAQKKLPGIQLFYHNDKKFMDKYRVTGIPRFIILDPTGKIVNAEAPKPSDPKLIGIFNDLKI